MHVQDLAQRQACAATINWWVLSPAVVGTTCTMLGKQVANEEALLPVGSQSDLSRRTSWVSWGIERQLLPGPRRRPSALV